MNTIGNLKKIAVLVPVTLLCFIFLQGKMYYQIHHISEKRQFALFLTIFILYVWMLVFVSRRTQDNVMKMVIQSSFFVYVFMVLTLTGYFILFREVTAQGWWEKVLMRIHQKDKVNLKPFHVLKIYRLSDLQIVGNILMLFPLAIYLPLLFTKVQGFIKITFVCMLVSISIELMQLATSYRITDIDDVILNTTGAALGSLVYLWIRNQYNPGSGI
jgi:glycopeptide antibiotics resistance protein